MFRSCFFLLLLLIVVSAVNGQGGRPNFNFKPDPPRHRLGVFGSASGNNGRNFNANVGVRGEYDLHRSKNGGRITGYAEGSQSFGRFNGHSYRGKPQGEIGVRAHIPF
ncbi:uncharacterized protein LOC144115858 isoform X1 [Amblyomma americanum]|uniref:Uncharacterized protein n=1 Tax=Amblyomma americanum TaxID=6943 RepID=A0AAQ4FC36_AMBAM